MPRSRRHAWWIALLLAAVAVTILNFWRLTTRDTGPVTVTPPALETPSPVAAPVTPAPLPEPSPTGAAQALEGTDEIVRRLAAGLSGHPSLARWLAHDHLVRRFVVVVDGVAAGRLVTQPLAFLEPGEDFSARTREDRIFVDPRSYRRYDVFAEVFASLDAEGSAALYRELEPSIEEAWRELGVPHLDFEERLVTAIRNLLAVPAPEGEIELDARVTIHEYADERLEALSPAQKQLLRMGPENLRKVQAKLRELAAALGLSIDG